MHWKESYDNEQFYEEPAKICYEPIPEIKLYQYGF